MAPTASDTLGALLRAVAAGDEPTWTQLTALSALGPEEAAELARAWPGLPAGTREELLVRTTELAEDDVVLDFVELGKVGLDDEDASVRLRAVESLWETEDRAVADRLVAILRGDVEVAVRTAAADCLNHFVMLRECEKFDAARGDAIVAALETCARDVAEPVEVRAGAIAALGPRNLRSVAEIVAEAYDDPDRRLHIAALRAMGDSGDGRWVDNLVQDFASADPEFRYEAVLAAGSIGSEETLGPLGELLEDEDSEVILSAIEALGETGGDEALSALLEFSKRSPGSFEEAVKSALAAASEPVAGRGGLAKW
jgi:HEAT repeat protein